MNFLEKLNLLLESRSLNKHVLSQLSGIPYTTIDGWYKKGYEGAKLPTIQKLADFFGTTIDYLVRDEIDSVNYGMQSNLNFSVGELNHINKYCSLNELGRQKADEYIEDLLCSPKYRIPDNLPIPDLEKIKQQFGPQIQAFRKNQSGLVKK